MQQREKTDLSTEITTYRINSREDLLAKIKETTEGKVSYKNKDYDDSLDSLLIPYNFRVRIQIQVEKLSELLKRVIEVFSSCLEARAFFQLSSQQEELALIDPGYSNHIVINRFDGLIEKGTGDYKVIENNSDCPAGILYTSRLMNLVASVPEFQTELIGSQIISESPANPEFLAHFISTYEEFRNKKQSVGLACILQLEGQENCESFDMAKYMTRLGIRTIVADPRNMKFERNQLLYHGQAVDLVWNKINTTYFNEVLSDSRICDFLKAYEMGAFCHINSFAARYVTESKLVAAFMHSPIFQKHLSKSDIDFIKSTIPWSYKLEQGDVDFKGHTGEIISFARTFKDQLVLKRAYDIRGDGVVIGKSLSVQEWTAVIKKNIGQPFILQEYIRPSEKEIQLLSGDRQHRYFSLDSFMHSGQFQGFGSKASLGDKLNIFQGGSKLAVFTLKEDINARANH